MVSSAVLALRAATGDLLDIILEAFFLHFFSASEGAGGWTACLDAFEGVDQIPLMTVHKSKGLEYDTIIFVVALSRAKQRAIFTFCQQRGGRNNRPSLSESRLMHDCRGRQIARCAPSLRMCLGCKFAASPDGHGCNFAVTPAHAIHKTAEK
jgi:hypothetical protein